MSPLLKDRTRNSEPEPTFMECKSLNVGNVETVLKSVIESVARLLRVGLPSQPIMLWRCWRF